MRRLAPRPPWIRTVLVALGALLALLVVIPAQTTTLWIIELLVREYGHYIAFVLFAIAVTLWGRTRARRITSAIGVAAGALLLVPMVQGERIARTLPQRIGTFGSIGDTTPRSRTGARAREEPLSLRTLVAGLRAPRITPELRRVPIASGDSLPIELYRPHGLTPNAKAPIVVMIHGGSWHSEEPDQLRPLNSYLAARGYLVARVSYRLAPANRFPAARDDVHAALEWLRANASAYGGDSSRIVLLGRSAGGHLSLLVGYGREEGVRGVVSLYGVPDLRWGYEHPSNPRVINSTKVLEDFLGGPPGARGDVYDSASAINRVSASTPPTLLIHGTGDELVTVQQSRRLASRLEAAKRPHLLLEMPWGTHGCDVNLAGPCGQLSTYAIERFVAAVTR